MPKGGSNNSSGGGSGSIFYKANGQVDGRCSAARNGAITFTNSGSINQTCSAVRSGQVSVTQSGMMDMRCQAAHNSGLQQQTSPKIILNSNGSVVQNCQAVKQGYVTLKQDGQVDYRCQAAKDRIFKDDGTIDQRTTQYKTSEQHIDSYKVERDPYAQYLYRQKSKSQHKDEQDADHIISINVMNTLLALCRPPGPKTTDNNNQLSKMINSKPGDPVNNFHMIDKNTNRSYNNKMDNDVIKLLNGDRDVKITKELINYIKVVDNKFQEYKAANPDDVAIKYASNGFHDMFISASNTRETVE